MSSGMLGGVMKASGSNFTTSTSPLFGEGGAGGDGGPGGVCGCGGAARTVSS